MTDAHDGGEAILAACRSLGVDVIFSSPGSEWAPVWEAMSRQQRDGVSGPRYVDLMHETLAVAMATGYGLVTGRPQLVLLHAGPGLLQGACGIHGALLTGVGMVICSAESITYGESEPDPGSQWYRNLSVVGGPQAMAASFTKWSSMVGSVQTLYGSVVRASELSRRSPAGPVYLNVPVEVLLADWRPAPGSVRPVADPGARVSPDAELEEVARRLVAAERPMVITESAGRAPGGFEGLFELADLLALPVVEPQSAVCSNFPRTSPLHQGADTRAAREADLILLVSCRAPWYPPSDRPADAVVVVIDEVPHRPHIDYQVLGADTYLEGDLGLTLTALAAKVKALGVDEERVAARAARLREAKASAASSTVPQDVLSAALVAQRLRELVDADARIVDETITHSKVIVEHLAADTPGRYSYVQGGLGQGLGVALGVKMATPATEVVLTIGDGSLLYNPIVQSLSAAKSLGLPLLIVVFNNHQYLSMKLNHLRFYPEGASAGAADFRGVDLTDQPPLAELVAPFGMKGFTVEQADSLDAVLHEALACVRAGVTALVDVHLDR